MAEDILVYDIDICLPRMVVWGEHGREDSFFPLILRGLHVKTTDRWVAWSLPECKNT